MSEASSSPDPVAGPRPSLGRIFWVFLVMGATSLGGGVVGYLRTGLVVRNNWLDDVTFVELLSISQTLPGLNATNMSILVGDRLRGAWGASSPPGHVPARRHADDRGRLCLRHRRRRSLVEGLPARHRRRRLGLIVVVMVQLGSRVLKGFADYVIVLATAAAVALLPRAGALRPDRAGIVAIWWHRPREGKVHTRPRTPHRSARGTTNEAARRYRGRLRLSLAAHRRRRHGGLPELKTLTVDTYHWVTFPEMLHFYSLGQLAPGPNMMMVVSIGAVVAGLPGAAVALIAFFLPTGILTWGDRPDLDPSRDLALAAGDPDRARVGLGRPGAGRRHHHGPRRRHRRACGPAIAIVVFVLLLKTKINPAYPIVASGLVGFLAHWLLSGPPPWVSACHRAARRRGTPMATVLPAVVRQPLFHSPLSTTSSMRRVPRPCGTSLA
jgi:chromate transporter